MMGQGRTTMARTERLMGGNGIRLLAAFAVSWAVLLSAASSQPAPSQASGLPAGFFNGSGGQILNLAPESAPSSSDSVDSTSMLPGSRPWVTTTTTTLPPVTRSDTVGITGTTDTTTTTTQPETTPTTVKNVCGGTELYCSVEYDSTGDGSSDCCQEGSNPTCANCLAYCKEYCGNVYKGVSTCFMKDKIPVCQCSENLPTCYKPVMPTTTTEAKMETGARTNITYFITFGFILAALAGAVSAQAPHR